MLPQSLFGYTSEEAIGRSLNQLVTPEDRQKEEAKLFAETLDHGITTYESSRRKKDGSFLYVDISNKTVRDASGAVSSY